jgi:hypothetical protein
VGSHLRWSVDSVSEHGLVVHGSNEEHQITIHVHNVWFLIGMYLVLVSTYLLMSYLLFVSHIYRVYWSSSYKERNREYQETRQNDHTIHVKT